MAQLASFPPSSWMKTSLVSMAARAGRGSWPSGSSQPLLASTWPQSVRATWNVGSLSRTMSTAFCRAARSPIPRRR